MSDANNAPKGAAELTVQANALASETMSFDDNADFLNNCVGFNVIYFVANNICRNVQGTGTWQFVPYYAHCLRK